MLPTNGKAEIFSKYEHNYESKSGYKLFNDSKGLNLLSTFTYHHLYILSDDKIEENNYYFDGNMIQIADKSANRDPKWYLRNAKKVIATTDIICIGKESSKIGDYKYLPQPSQSFINKYIEKYNKGEIITEVMVEFVDNGEEEWMGDDYNGGPFWNEKIELKINSKDNTITIKTTKDSWNREEVIQLIRTFDMMKGKDITTVEFDNWIEQNL